MNTSDFTQLDLLLKEGRFDEAESYCRIFLLHSPNRLQSLNYLARILCYQQKYEEAIHYTSIALAQSHNHPSLLINLGNIYVYLERFEKAIQIFLQVIQIDPSHFFAYYHLGYVFQTMGQLTQACEWYQQALTYAPCNVDALNNLGFCYHLQGLFEIAADYYDRALLYKPDFASPHFNRACIWLTQSRWKEGWEEYEWRFKLEGAQKIPTFHVPYRLWQGEDLKNSKLLILSEQGFGDNIQFMRYVCLAKEKAREVSICVPQELKKLYQYNFPNIRIIDAQTEWKEYLFDYYIYLMSLPRFLGNCIDQIPHIDQYILPDRMILKEYQHVIGETSNYKIGIVWQGRPTHFNDKRRSIRLEDLFKAIHIDGVTIYSLQKGKGEEQLNSYLYNSIIDLGSSFKDFCDTAAAIANLDLIITVDTAVAHLAAAMNKPTWVLLPYVPDWRWGVKRNRSVWYSSIRLFRQETNGLWQNVLEDIRRELLVYQNQ